MSIIAPLDYERWAVLYSPYLVASSHVIASAPHDREVENIGQVSSKMRQNSKFGQSGQALQNLTSNHSPSFLFEGIAANPVNLASNQIALFTAKNIEEFQLMIRTRNVTNFRQAAFYYQQPLLVHPIKGSVFA